MKNRDLIIIILLNLVILVIGIFVSYLISNQLADVNKVGSEIAGLEANRAGLSELRRQLAGLKEDKLKLDEYVVTNNNTDVLLDHLEVIGKQAGVEMKVTSASAGDQLAIAMSVKGPYANIARYLELLSTVHYLISFNRINLQLVPDGSHTWAGSITLNLLSYQP